SRGGRRLERGTQGAEALLDAAVLHFATDQRIENGQNVPAVFHHAAQDIPEVRLALHFPVPLGQHRWGYFDILPQPLRGMPAQEKPIEKGRLTLRKVQVRSDFGGHEWSECRHIEKRSLPKSRSASSRTSVLMPRAGQYAPGPLHAT